MAGCSLRIKPSAASEIDDIAGKADRRRVVERIERLAEEPRPRGCVKLAGGEHYRVRQGRYRIVYDIRDAELIVLVIRVGDRRDVHRGT
ncbi:MAG: type II toxin-antitoxin system RelE/ParE family toxin [Trueperaceae bacterium]|nr:type II toxin-antitoxin system RelE/ParE family toxin [Trueperaceae bacterium]